MQTNMAATLNLDWLVHLIQDAACLGGAEVSRGNEHILRALDEAVLKVRPGAVLFHPFISSSGERGPFIDPFARAGLLGIDQNVRLPEVARAVYDGLACGAGLLCCDGWASRERANHWWRRSLGLDACDPGCMFKLSGKPCSS